MFKQLVVYSVMIISVSLGVALFAGSPAFAAEPETGGLEMMMKAAGAEDGIPLKSTVVDGTQYFFLPSGVTKENLEYSFGEDTSYETMQSANIASVHFFSSDPEKKGMDYIHNSEDHSTKAKGTVYMFDQDFKLLYQGEVGALKGRGNTTWIIPQKKSYQMKLEKKADLLDPEKGKQKAKTWLLLGNPFDPTLIRNYMIYNFAKEIGIDCTPEGRPVDVYYDGQYRGSYYLCEKVEIGEGRLEIDDLEKAVEDANPDVDFDGLEEATASQDDGINIKYEKGIKSPEDITGGYLLELDSVYYSAEKSWFGYREWAVVSKSPEYLSEEMVKYISRIYTDMYEYVHGEYYRFGEGDDLSKYIDLDSFARYFLVNEWFCNNDVWTSSTYFYKPKGDDRIYAGPVWDCDASMRISEGDGVYDQWFAPGLGKLLLGLPVFRQKVQTIYREEMGPVIRNILLGNETGTYLKPAKAMKEELAASAAMNYKIWDIDDCVGSYQPKDTVEANYDEIMNWMTGRAKWFDKQIMSDSFVPNQIAVGKVKSVNTSTNAAKRTCKVSFGKTKVRYGNVAWGKAFNAKDYRIAYRKAGAKKWKQVKTGGKRTYTLKNVARGGVYEVRVQAAAQTKPAAQFGKYSAVSRVFIQNVSPKLKTGKKKVKVQWVKVPKANLYQIRISTNKSMKGGKIINSKAKKRTIGKLKSGKKYYVQMRCCRTVKGKKYFTGWSAAKAVTVK